MNRSYRLVWNEASQRHVPAPESARGRGKNGRAARATRAAGALRAIGAGLGLSLLAGSGWALDSTALPSGGTVVQGQASIGAPILTPAGGVSLTVTQTSQRAVTNWLNHDVGGNASVVYVQPNSGAVMLSRVIGGGASQIDGHISANGQVFLVNPSGVLFGAGAQVNVHGLLVTTLDTLDSDFMAGTLRFSGSGTAAVRNAGTLQTDGTAGGFVALLGGQVSNTGTITAQIGSVALASGSAATLDFNGDGLLSVAVTGGAAHALTGNTGTLQADGGRVQMSAASADALISAVVHNSGTVQARGLTTRNGVIELSGDVIHQGGTLDASGAQGGTVLLSGRSVLQDGLIRADGSVGAGGQIGIQATQTLLQTEAAELSADGTTQGGRITLDGGQRATLSGRVHASGAQGGQVLASAATLLLAGAQVKADGTTQGGQLLLGAAEDGAALGTGVNGAAIATAGNTTVNASTTLSAAGAQGRIIVWGGQAARYDGSATTGAAGLIEVGSHAGSPFISGSANAGAGGEQRVVADDLVIGGTVTPPASVIDLLDPTRSAGDRHGSGGVTQVGGGNIVVASPDDNFGGAGAGAVYLYNGSSGALVSALFGTTAGDRVGSGGVTALANGNHVIASPVWNNAGQALAGAATWGSGTRGVSGAIAAGNSLVGAALDQVGSAGVTALSDGNYAVASPQWGSQRGAVTWGNGSTGTTGAVVATGSLTGSTAGDRVGSKGVTALANGRYVVNSPAWSGGLGAVTWQAGGAAATDVVSVVNSLVGSVAGDAVGSGGVTALANGHYVVASPDWNSGALLGLGAVTWGSGATGATGVVGAANSLIGAAAFDHLGSGGVTALTNGNYVIASPLWDGAVVNAGAVTWANGSTGLTGSGSAANSLVGSTTNDQVGSGGVTALTNGNYVVASPDWDRGTVADAGAATWGNGASGSSGAVGTGNSLVGSHANDRVSADGVTALSNGNAVVASANWNNQLGAVTWLSGTAATAAEVGAANSLTGSVAGDRVGSGGVTALTNGHYVVASPDWSDATLASIGAVTWADGTSGLAGAVTVANSLTGGSANDRLGSGGVTALKGGDYVIASPLWDSGTVVDAGSVSRASGTSASSGLLAAGSTLSGTTTNDHVGSGGVTALSNGSYAVSSPDWNAAGAPLAGAVWLPVAGTTTAYSLDRMGPASTTLTLRATRDLTVSQAVTVDAKVLAQAGRTLTLDAPIRSAAVDPAAVTLVSGGNFVNHAGAVALVTPNGHWQVWSVDPALDTLGGLAYDFKQYAATYGTTTVLGSGNGVLYTIAPVLTPVLSGTATKVYDGNTTAPRDQLTLATTGQIDGDSVAINAAAIDYATRNVGTGINLTASGLSFTATHGSAPVYGYQLAAPTAVDVGGGTITPKALTVNGTTAQDKVYDANTTATIGSAGTLTGVVSGDVVTLSGQSGSFADKNVGTAKPVTIVNTISGGDAGNYTVASSATTASITPRALAVTGTTAQDKIYDANTNATLGTAGTLVGVQGSDVLTLAQSGTFADKNVGNAKPVTIANTVTGTDVGNYTIGSSTTTASITPRALTVSGSQARDKVYDSTTAATLSSAGTLGGVHGSDVLTLTQVASFADKNVGNAKPVAIVNTVSGTELSNYVLSTPTSASSASITPAALSVTGTTALDKIYDANTTATIGSAGTLNGVYAGDIVTLSGQRGSFADKNVGNAKPVAIINTIGGGDAGNYTVASSATTASITPLTLSVTGSSSAASRVYDGTTVAQLSSNGTLAGALAGDTVTLQQNGAFADKNVGAAKPVAISNTLLGSDAGNYVLSNPQLSSSADITARTLTVTGTTIADKVYDASTAATFSRAGALDNLVSGDSVTLVQNAAFRDRNVGSAKPVDVVNGISGTDAANYTLSNAQLTSAASITPRTLSMTGTTAADKVYDATTAATLVTPGTLVGVLGSDVVALSGQNGSFADKNVGVAKPVTIVNTIGGGDAGNYVVTSSTTTASISPRLLALAGTTAPLDKMYDGTTAAALNSNAALVGVISGDAVALSQSGTFNSHVVGQAKSVAINNRLVGQDASNYLVADASGVASINALIGSDGTPYADGLSAVRTPNLVQPQGRRPAPGVEIRIPDESPQKLAAAVVVEPPSPPPPQPPVVPPAIAETRPVQVPVLPPAEVIIFASGVLFDTDLWEIKPEAQQELTVLAGKLLDAQARVVVVTGHTDSRASDAHNMRLSRHRAEAVQQFLRDAFDAQGKDGRATQVKVTAEWKGESCPVATNRTEEGMAQNRRVVIEWGKSADFKPAAQSCVKK
jgi:filamentous hemagglutinin family protein